MLMKQNVNNDVSKDSPMTPKPIRIEEMSLPLNNHFSSSSEKETLMCLREK